MSKTGERPLAHIASCQKAPTRPLSLTYTPYHTHTHTLKGTYIITDIINWRKPIVLRGEGRDRTFIKFPKSMTDLCV